jgi:hypothetical protein
MTYAEIRQQFLAQLPISAPVRLPDLGAFPCAFPCPSPALGGADLRHHTVPIPCASRSPIAAPAAPFSLTPASNLPTLVPKPLWPAIQLCILKVEPVAFPLFDHHWGLMIKMLDSPIFCDKTEYPIKPKPFLEKMGVSIMASELEHISDLLQEIAETLKDIRDISHSSCEELIRISSELHELREMTGEVKQIISANEKNE